MLKFEDAEKAFNAGNYEETLKHLDEVEKTAGVTSKTLYLRIVTENKLFDNGAGFYEDEGKFVRLQRIRENAKKYLNALSKQSIDDKYREIYRISEALDSFPKTKQEWQVEHNRILKQKSENALWAANCRFEDAGAFSEGLCRVKFEGLWGAIDKQGKQVVACQYEAMGDFHEGLAGVKVKGKFGYINKRGEWVIRPQYDRVGNFLEGLACVRNLDEKSSYFLDSKGKVVIEIKCREATGFSEGLAAFVDKKGKYGYINKKGEIAIKPKYNSAGYFKDGIAKVNSNTFINKEEKELFSISVQRGYNGLGSFDDGLALVLKNKKYGFIDKTGKEVIPLQYDDVLRTFFDEGLAPVKIGDKWGFIDKTGRQVIAPQFDGVTNFSENMAGFRLGDKRGFIDKSGKIVMTLPSECQSVSSFNEGLARIKMNDKWGFVDKNNNVLKIK